MCHSMCLIDITPIYMCACLYTLQTLCVYPINYHSSSCERYLYLLLLTIIMKSLWKITISLIVSSLNIYSAIPHMNYFYVCSMWGPLSSRLPSLRTTERNYHRCSQSLRINKRSLSRLCSLRLQLKWRCRRSIIMVLLVAFYSAKLARWVY